MTDELAVYNNYRAALAAQSGGHAAQRRQTARTLTVQRYHVSYAEVKSIVAKFDAQNNVTHEHTDKYLRELELDLARKAFIKNPVPCTCGSTEEVYVRVNPYEIEVNGVYEFGPMCLNCWSLSYLDI